MKVEEVDNPHLGQFGLERTGEQHPVLNAYMWNARRHRDVPLCQQLDSTSHC